MQKILIKLLPLFIWIKSLKISRLLYLFCNIFTFIFIVYLVVLFSRYYTVTGDDLYQIFFLSEKSIFRQLFIDVYHGRYIGNFLTKFVGSVLPNLFSIHINVWIQTWGALIKGVFLAIFCFLLANFMFTFNKRTLITPIAAFICYLFYQYNFLGNYQNVLYTSFFGFTFPFIFLFVFFLCLINYSFQLKDINVKLLYVFAFLTGISTEFTSLVCFFQLSLLLIFYKKVFGNSVKPVKNSFIFLISGMILYYLNPGFIACAQNKGVFITFKSTISYASSVYADFVKGYAYIFYSEFFYYIIGIILLLLIIYLTSKYEIKNKFLLYISSFTISGFLFYALLILGGDTHNTNYSLYVYHFDLIMQMKIYFAMILLFELGILMKKIYIFIPCIVILCVFNLYTNTSDNVKELFYLNKYLKHGNLRLYTEERKGRFYRDMYKERYLIERIYAFYCYKNIPVKIVESTSFSDAATYIPYIEIYFNNVYNNYPYISAVAPNIEELYKYYLNDGGIEISDKEIKDSDFQSLLDKNFVLYNKQ